MKKIVLFSTLTALAPTVFAGTPTPPETPLPEPSTWLLFGAAAVAILAIKKFKK